MVPVPKAGLTAAEVEAHCRKRLPAFKTPEEVIFLAAMPHNSSGKILKLKLKEMLANRAESPATVPTPPAAAVLK